MKPSLSKILKRGKAMILSYDQGLEHGPESDFNDKNVDPLYIIDIAKKGRFTALVFHKGLAESYKKEIKASKVPLVVKLNGKTNLKKGNYISKPTCTVKEAMKLGADAVGYTIYIGSIHEGEMFEDFDKIQKEAHKNNLPVITWIYPRGKDIKNDVSRKNMAYAARTALELGADIAKIKYGGKPDDLKWAIKSAARTKVVIAGGTKKNPKKFLKDVKNIIDSGAIGIAVGRNVWQAKDPLGVANNIRRIIWK
jgi:class I fructose-bisphosphate aldolase|tara:strand:- start:1549 stop:2304 length:756 start_codon:yes stop_codon:yes gene_type:complete